MVLRASSPCASSPTAQRALPTLHGLRSRHHPPAHRCVCQRRHVLREAQLAAAALRLGGGRKQAGPGGGARAVHLGQLRPGHALVSECDLGVVQLSRLQPVIGRDLRAGERGTNRSRHAVQERRSVVPAHEGGIWHCAQQRRCWQAGAPLHPDLQTLRAAHLFKPVPRARLHASGPLLCRVEEGRKARRSAAGERRRPQESRRSGGAASGRSISRSVSRGRLSIGPGKKAGTRPCAVRPLQCKLAKYHSCGPLRGSHCVHLPGTRGWAAVASRPAREGAGGGREFVSARPSGLAGPREDSTGPPGAAGSKRPGFRAA